MALKERLTNEEYVARAKAVHGDEYDYSNLNYVNSKTKVSIICRKHGEFTKIPFQHTDMKQGCPICVAEKLGRTYNPSRNGKRTDLPKEEKVETEASCKDGVCEVKWENDPINPDNVIKNLFEDEAKEIVVESPRLFNKETFSDQSSDQVKRDTEKKKIKEYLMKKMIKFFPDYRSNGNVYDFYLNDKNLLVNVGGMTNILNIKDFEGLKKIF